MLKSEKGVTLIALLVTLLVMMFLTGVVLRFTVSDHAASNGILFEVADQRVGQEEAITDIEKQNDNAIATMEHDWGIGD